MADSVPTPTGDRSAAADADATLRARLQFDRTAAEYASSVPHATSDSLAIVRRWVAGRRYPAALDIATGPGFTAFAIAPYCERVVASDIAPAMLQRVEEGALVRLHPNIDTAIADACELPFPNDSFDLITCRTAPHHFPDIAQFLAEVRRTLRPSGMFILVDTTTVEASEPRAWHHRVELARDPSHVLALTPDEWRTAITNAGLKLTADAMTSVTMTFNDWVARSHTPANVVAELRTDFANVSAATRTAFRVAAIAEDSDFQFTWPVYAASAIAA